MNSQDCGLDNETFCGGTPDDEPAPDPRRSLGDSPAFPPDGYEHHEHGGMSYRMWLIGQALAGAMNPSFNEGETAQWALDVADEVLARLAK